MYNPERFKVNNQAELEKFILENPFASIISIKKNEIDVSHLPLVLHKENEQLFLYGHMARDNSQWRTLENTKVKVTFLGAHAYISPKLYEVNDVPTWNYIAAHIGGITTLIKDEKGIIDCLVKLNKSLNSSWKFFIPEDLQNGELSRAIVGFKIRVLEMDFKKKLSQNKSKKDQITIIESLEKANDFMSQELGSQMRKHYENF